MQMLLERREFILMPTFGIRVHSVKFIPAVHPALDESLTNLLLFILRGEC